MLFKQFLQKNLIWIVLAIVLIGGAFFLFAEIADDVFEKEKFQIDQMASQFVSSIQSDTLDSIFGFITELGAVWLIATGSIIVGIILLFYPSNRLWRVLYFAVTMIGISVLTSSLKELLKETDRISSKNMMARDTAFQVAIRRVPWCFMGLLFI